MIPKERPIDFFWKHEDIDFVILFTNLKDFSKKG